MTAVMEAPAPASGAGTTPVLECRGVTVRFGGVVAVNDVSVSVPPSSVVGLVGPNGAGKSTLFSVLSGLRRPNAGQVLLSGADVTKLPAHKRASHGVGRTFQHPELFPDLSVREHVTLAHRLFHTRKRLWLDGFTGRGFRPGDSAEQDRVEEVLRGLSLAQVADQPVGGLPLGTARLVELARALAGTPKVLLLDEPSSGLDARETAQVLDILRLTVERRAVSLLLVEHDVALVLKHCSQIAVLDFGTMIATGTPDQIANNEAVRTAYLGSVDE